MDKLSAALKRTQAKNTGLPEAILGMTHEWKGMGENLLNSLIDYVNDIEVRERKLDSVRGSLQKRLEDLVEREKEFDRGIRLREEKLDEQLEAVQQHIASLEAAQGDAERLRLVAREKMKDIECRERNLSADRRLISEKEKEVDLIRGLLEKRLGEVEERMGELVLKEEKLRKIGEELIKEVKFEDEKSRAREKVENGLIRRLELAQEKLEGMKVMLDAKFREMESREKKALETEEAREIKFKELGKMEREFNSFREAKMKELASKDQELTIMRKKIESREQSVAVSSRDATLIRESADARLKEIEKWEKELRIYQGRKKKELLVKEEKLSLMREELIRYAKFSEDRLAEQERSVNGFLERVELAEATVMKMKIRVDKKFKEISSKQIEVKSLKDWVDKKMDEIKSKENELKSRERRVQAREDAIVTQENELGEKRKELEWKETSLDSREKDLEFEKQSVESRKEELENQEKRVKAEEDALTSKSNGIEKTRKELALKARKLVSLKNDVELKQQCVESKSKEVENQEKEVKAKEEDIISKGIELEKKIKALELREIKLGYCEKELELMQQQVKSRSKELENQEKGLKSKEAAVVSKDNALGEKRKELELKERNLGSGKKELELEQKHCEELEHEENNLNTVCKNRFSSCEHLDKRCQRDMVACHATKSVIEPERRLRQLKPGKQTGSHFKELGLKELQVTDVLDVHQRIEPYVSGNFKLVEKVEGKVLERIISNPKKDPWLMADEIFEVLLSSDPAKLVLDVVGAFYAPHFKTDVDFNSRKLCAILLERFRTLPEIQPCVKEEAVKIACALRSKLTTASPNWLEVSGFLLLLAAYNISSFFERDEIFGYLCLVPHHTNTPELCRILGFTEKMPDFIQNLIHKNYLLASTYIHEFELGHMFPQSAVLNYYIKHSMQKARAQCKMEHNSFEAQDKALVSEIHALNTVIEHLIRYGLESEYPLDTLTTEIKQLEMSLAGLRSGRNEIPPSATHPGRQGKGEFHQTNNGFKRKRPPKKCFATNGAAYTPETQIHEHYAEGGSFKAVYSQPPRNGTRKRAFAPHEPQPQLEHINPFYRLSEPMETPIVYPRNTPITYPRNTHKRRRPNFFKARKHDGHIM